MPLEQARRRREAIFRVLFVSTLILLTVSVVILIRVGDLDEDDNLIDRGQQVDNCTGTLADYGQTWLAISVEELVTALTEAVATGQASQETLDNATLAAERVTRLSAMRVAVREDSAKLIEEGSTDFECPPIAPDLIPPV